MTGSGVAWPPGPYRLADHRKRRWMEIGFLALIAGPLLMIGAHLRDPWVPQNLADLAVTWGLGDTVDGAAVESTNCGRYTPDTIWEHGQRGIRHQCTVRIRGAMNTDYEFRTGYSGAYEPGRVARVFGRIAVAWPGWVMVERLTILGTTVVIGLLVALFGAVSLRMVRAERKFEVAGARIVDVDLLCRKMLPRGALWHFACDRGGPRRYATLHVHADPVVTDGIVTRGAAILAADGDLRLLTRDVTPGLWPAAVEDAIGAIFYGYRAPLLPGFEDLASRAAPGPERDFVTAFGQAWHDPDVARVNAAILARHDAALLLDPARVDALLRECRRYVPG